jgi:hypothetical protein
VSLLLLFSGRGTAAPTGTPVHIAEANAWPLSTVTESAWRVGDATAYPSNSVSAQSWDKDTES